MVEFRQSIRIVRQALEGLPEGPVSPRPGVKSVGQVRVPKGEGYARVEGARGEVGCYLVSDGGPKPYRMKWRGASFSNLAVLPHIVPGHKVADVVAIMRSEEHTSELQSPCNLVCRLLLEKKKNKLSAHH